MVTLLSSPPLPPVTDAINLSILHFGKLDLVSCRNLWRQAFGQTPQKHVSLQLMRRMLAYEAQCKTFGGLPADVKRAFKHLSKQVLKGV